MGKRTGRPNGPRSAGETKAERAASLAKSLAERFENGVGPIETNGCKLWTGGRSGNGYGQIWGVGRNRGAHIVAWETVNGPIPPGLVIRHQCHVPLCVNVEHMKLGTHSDNAQDMRAAGRSPKWTGRKVTDRDAVAMLGYGMLGFTQAKTAAAFGVSLGTVQAVRNNRAHVASISREVDKLYDRLDVEAAKSTAP